MVMASAAVARRRPSLGGRAAVFRAAELPSEPAPPTSATRGRGIDHSSPHTPPANRATAPAASAAHAWDMRRDQHAAHGSVGAPAAAVQADRGRMKLPEGIHPPRHLDHRPHHHRHSRHQDRHHRHSHAPPHFHKNPHIRRGYAIHAAPVHAVRDAMTTLHNETANIATGLLTGAVAIVLAAAVARHEHLLDDHHETLLLALAAMLGFNAFAVSAYHTLCSVPELYHAASALDLLGISMLSAGIAAATALPGMRATAGIGIVDPYAILALSLGYIATIALAAAAIRLHIRRESPPVLLLLNCSPFILLLPDYVAARWQSPTAVAVPLLLVVGAVLFAVKFPERAFPGKFDLIGHSHMLWHIAYAASATCFAADAFAAALDASQAAVRQ